MTSNLIRNKSRFFDLWAPNYDCLFTTIFYQAIHKRMLEFVELTEKPNVLDLGCGTGRLLDRLAKGFTALHGTGFDLSPEMLRQAKQRNCYPQRLMFVQGNAEAMPFNDQEFEAVFNTISFLHYPHPKQVLSEIHRVLCPRGKFYLADYTVRENIGSRTIPFSPGGLLVYSPKQREKMAQEVGLQCQGHYYLLGPVMLSIFQRNSG